MFNQIPNIISREFANDTNYHMALLVPGFVNTCDHEDHFINNLTNHFTEINNNWYTLEIEEVCNFDVKFCEDGYIYLFIEFCECNPSVNDVKKWAQCFESKRGVKIVNAWLNGNF